MSAQEPTLVAATPKKPARAQSEAGTRVRVIEPGTVSLIHLVKDLWRSRELLFFLTWRDIKVRYKQTALGVLWAILQPVISMVVLSIVFGRLAGIGKTITSHVPYPVFVYSGLLPWTFFASTLGSSSNSVLGNAALINKIRFPRIALPIAASVGEMVDFGLSFLVLIGLMLWYHVPIRAGILFIPFLTLGVCMVALGLGSIFASLTVKYRDFRYIVPFVTQIWMFLTPVIYPINFVVSKKHEWLFNLNPLSGWVGAFRAALLGDPLNWGQLGISVGVSVVVLLAGVYYFRRTERRFAELI